MGIFSRLFQRGQEGERAANEGDKPASPAFDEATAVPPEAEPAQVAAGSPALATALASGGSASLAAPFWGWPRHSEPADPVVTPPANVPEEPASVAPSPSPSPKEEARRPVIPSVTKAEKAPDPPKAIEKAEGAEPTKAEPPKESTKAQPVTAPRRQSGKGKRDDSTMIMSPPPIVPAAAMRPIPAPPPGAMSEQGATPAAASVAAPASSAQASPEPSAQPSAMEAAPMSGLESTLASLAGDSFLGDSSAFPADGSADGSVDGSVEAIDGDEISASFNRLLMDDSELGVAAPVAVSKPVVGVSTAEDLAAVRDVFNDIAVVHVSQVRDVMLELRFGDADPAWLESTKPALRSLRAMAEQMELAELCKALDTFCVAVDAAVANRARISDEDKTLLLERYHALSELIPAAFELDAERDRREPIIVEALLYQIDGVEKPIIDRLFAVGLNRLDALLRVNHDDLVMMAGLRPEVAAAIVDQFRTYRATADAAVSTRDPLAERRSLGDLVIMLSILQDDFLRASDDWSVEARARKRSLRKEREQTFQRIRVSLVRLGDREQLAKLERLPFNERIAALERYVANQPMARA